MNSYLLPRRPRRAWLRAFWLSMSICAGLLSGIIAAWLITPGWGWMGVAVTMAVAIPGVSRPGSIAGAYAFWNRAAQRYATSARKAVLTVSFHTVIRAVGRDRTTFRMERPELSESLWTPRASVPLNRGGDAKSSWVTRLARHASDAGSAWIVALVPFLALLRTFDEDESGDTPANIYTLY